MSPQLHFHIFKPDLQNNILELKGKEEVISSVVHLQFNSNKARLVSSAYRAGTVDFWHAEDGSLSLPKTIRSPGKLGPIKHVFTSVSSRVFDLN
jgi:hypothetical protein